MIRTQTKGEFMRVKSLIRNECANCFSDDCAIFDTKCPQLHSQYSLICNYFTDAVLPFDAVLCTQLLKPQEQAGIKHCIDCKDAFVPTGNRSQRCKPCAIHARRRGQAESKRNKRMEAKKSLQIAS